jgi:glycosyltransferase involved in cell wall biosynthesis
LVCLGAKDDFEPDWYEHLQEVTATSAFSERIHWIGQVSDVRSWYHSAYILALASENEAFGRILIEAMACNIPVVATSSGGIPEIVRHGQDGLLVKAGNKEEMEEALLRMLTDDDFRESCIRSGRERVDMFSLQSHVAKMVDVFEKISA